MTSLVLLPQSCKKASFTRQLRSIFLRVGLFEFSYLHLPLGWRKVGRQVKVGRTGLIDKIGRDKVNEREAWRDKVSGVNIVQ